MASPGAQAARVLHGPSLVGIFLNVMLYGVMIAQTHTYYTTFPKDRVRIKVYVAVLLLADTLNSAFNIAWIYNILINNFGNFDALARADWLFESEEAMAGLTAMLVQLFYAWRLRVLTRNAWVVGLVVASSCVSGLCAVGTAVAISMRPEIAGFKSLDVIALPWLISCTVCDVTIAIALTVYLNAHKTGMQRTDNVLNKLIRSTVQSGLLTASFTIAHIVAYLTSHTGIHMIFNYAVVKLYTNFVMSSLNARREHLNSLAGESSLIDIHTPTFARSTGRSLRPEVAITVETHELTDDASFPQTKHDGTAKDSTSTLDFRHDEMTHE
ncbi:hypothetical protein PsYK624_079930 [Phanerochaete sordida]|uniref:DUF6534 domain-containing protein n=1 Tax=Phanerochaete sordida TaxID=48140 RepID=A0A9P3LFB1_9APHY|nr:hypothetical protein PsYK624_079930 [Phanerochaete sordida]